MGSANGKIIIFLGFVIALSGCSDLTSFDKLLDSNGPQNSHSSITPAPSPSASATPTKTPVSVQPPAQTPVVNAPVAQPIQTPTATDLGKMQGDYESADGELQIASDNSFFMRLKEVSSLKATGSTPEQYAYCTFERQGQIQSIAVVNNQTIMNIKILTEKVDAAAATTPNTDAAGICAAVSTALADEPSFSIEVIGTGAGYLSIAWERKNTENTADSVPSNGKLGSLFVDPNSGVDITQILFATIGSALIGSHGTQLESDTIPRLELQWTSSAQTVAFSDNECGFGITSKIQAIDKAGQIALTSVGTPQMQNPLTTTAAQAYSVYVGRKSGECSTREQTLDEELTHFEIGLAAQNSNGTYGISYSSSLQYLVRSR